MRSKIGVIRCRSIIVEIIRPHGVKNAVSMLIHHIGEAESEAPRSSKQVYQSKWLLHERKE